MSKYKYLVSILIFFLGFNSAYADYPPCEAQIRIINATRYSLQVAQEKSEGVEDFKGTTIPIAPGNTETIRWRSKTMGQNKVNNAHPGFWVDVRLDKFAYGKNIEQNALQVTAKALKVDGLVQNCSYRSLSKHVGTLCTKQACDLTYDGEYIGSGIVKFKAIIRE